MNRDPIFEPMAAMPDVVSRALYRSTTSPARDSEVVPEIFNPWIPDERRLQYTSEEDEEAALQSSMEPVKKLFNPAPVRITPGLGDLSPLPPENPDAEEREMCTPVAKLFHPDVRTAASGSPSDFSKQIPTPAPQEDWDSPLAKRSSEELTFKTRRDADGFIWREGYDSTGEVKCARVVYDDENQ